MLRPIVIAAALALLAVAGIPRDALAWSERPAPTNTDGSSKFTDPDERVEAMTGRSENGTQGQVRSLTPQSDRGGWSFGVTQSPSSSFSPYSSRRDSERPGRW